MNEIQTEWFIARNKQRLGPFTWAQLLEQVGSGDISGVDMILQKGEGKWVKADSLPGLFATQRLLPKTAPPKTVEPVVQTPAQESTVSLAAMNPAQAETVEHQEEVPATHAGPLPKSAQASAALTEVVPGYEYVGVLGRGGMGVVYKARHVALDRMVALKMILAGEHADADSLERFRIEGQAVARLQHPNIVQIHEVGEHDGRPFFSLEFADGGTLAARIKGDPWTPRQAAEVTVQLARAMQHAHDHGIIHRDLKPGNVLFSADGTPKITDFGLAKRLDDDQNLSRTGAILGTPSYMAPEQAEGKSDIGPAADVYALGVILYELLTGRAPFKGASMFDTLDQVRTQEPVPPTRLAKVPIDLETICLKCLHKAPTQRYGSAAELSDDLNRFLRGEPVKARPIGRLGQVWRWCLRNKAVASFMVLFVLALVVGTTVSAIFGVIANMNAVALADKVIEEQKATERANLATADAQEKQKIAEEKTKLADDKSKLAAEKTKETQNALQQEQAANLAEKAAKKKAEAAKVKAERLKYSSDMNRAFLELMQNNPADTREIVDASQEEYRGWEHEFLKAQLFRGAPFAYGATFVSPTIAMSKDEKTIVAAINKGTMTIINVEPLQFRQTIKAGSFYIRGLAFNSDGTRFASVTDQSLWVWDTATGSLITKWDAGVTVHNVAFSPDDEFIAVTASGPLQGHLKIWEIKTQKEVHSAVFLDGSYGLAWSPDGSQLALSGWKRSNGVMLFNRKAELLQTLEPRESVSAALAFSPDGKWLAAGGGDGTVRIWDLAKRTLRHTSPGHTATITSVAFRQDSQQLASASWDNSVRLWDVATGKEISVLRGHAHHVHSVLYQADGGLLTSSSDKTLRRWDPIYFQRVFRAHAAQFRFAPDGESIWGITRMRHRLDIDLRTHEVKDEWIKGTPDGVGYAESISHEGRMACGLKSRLDIQSRANPHKWLSILEAHQGQVHATAFHPDGSRLASSGDDNLIKLWDADSGKLLQTMSGHNNTAHALAFSADGRKLAGGTRSGGVFVWNSGTGKLEHDFPPHTDMIRSLAFSPDGAHLASTGFDRKLNISSLADGKQLHSLLASAGPIEAVIYFPDGKRLATAGLDKTIRLWDTASMYEVLVLRGHTARIDGLAVSSDGKRLASRSTLDGTFRIWDASQPPPQLTGLGTRRPPATKTVKDPVEIKADDTLARARVSLQNKQWDQAAELYAQAAAQAAPTVRAQVAREYALAGARDRIPEFYANLVKRNPNDRRLWLESGRMAAEVSQWPRAAADYARLVRYTEDDLFESLCLCLMVNDQPRFNKLNAGFINRAEKKQIRPYLAARMFTLVPPTSADDQKRIERVAEQELTTMDHRYAALTVQGALDVRAGRHDEAQKKLRQCLTRHPNWEGLVLPRLWLALSLQGQGNAEEARKELALAVAQLDKWGQHMPNSPLRAGFVALHLHDWLEAQVLRREVEKALAK